MAQEYEIDIKRFNGQDYDTLLPTPAAHAATHRANGSDPITMQTGNYGDNTVTGEKIVFGAVSRIYPVLIPTTGWQRYNNNANNVFYIDLTVNGVSANDRGDLMLQRGIASDITTYTISAFETDIEKFSHIVAANITADNTLRLFADEVPSGSIYCFLRVVKK